MDQFKSPASRLARLFRASRDAWKAKALDKQRRLRAAQVRIRDLEKSRAYWKARAQASAEPSPPPAPAPSATPPSEERSETPTRGTEQPSALLALPAPAGHHYGLMVMYLSIDWLCRGLLSSRGVSRILEPLALPVGTTLPAHTTVLNWTYRCGLALLKRPVERRSDWIFIIDHTVALGTSKCLLVLGIPAAHLSDTGYSPAHEAMTVLAVELTTHSDGAWVAEVLWQVAQRTGVPVQIVADHGSDLRKGIRLFQQAHAPQCVETYDISHRVATLLKAELGQDARYQAFLTQCSRTRTAYQQTDLAFLLPPRQRTKARFMHVSEQVQWAEQMLAYADRGDFSAIGRPYVFSARAWWHLRWHIGAPRAQALSALIGHQHTDQAVFCQTLFARSDLRPEELDETFWSLVDTGRARFMEAFAWLLPERESLRVYAQLLEQSNQVQKALKKQGLSRDVAERLTKTLAPSATLNPRVAAFTTTLLEHVRQEAAKLPAGKTWLASSDSIESVFGSYKRLAERSPLKEMGKLVLTLPLMLTKLTTSMIREALESVHTQDVEQWAREHLGVSLLAKRRRALKAPTMGTETA